MAGVTFQDKQPEQIGFSLICLRVCVPRAWSDDEIRDFAERTQPCGTTAGWDFRKVEGHDEQRRALDRNGDLIYCPCEQHPDFVHVVLEEPFLNAALTALLGALEAE